MFEEFKYRIELHSHTSPASACSEIPPEKLVEIYHEIGCHAIAVTNHFTCDNFKGKGPAAEIVGAYMSDFYRAREAGEMLGMSVLFGMELRFAENNNDYLIYGVDEKEALIISGMLGEGVAEFRRDYKNDRAVFIQAHPFRNGMTQPERSLLDGIEAFNMHPHHNARVAVAAKYAREHNMLAIAGTDCHHWGHQGLGMTLSKTLPRDSYELAALIKSGDFLMEIGGYILI